MIVDRFKYASENEFSIPLNLFEIIDICKEYNNLNTYLQKQISNIMSEGISHCIENKLVDQKSFPELISFFEKIINNQYFGEARDQAIECVQVMSLCVPKHNKVLN
jgi:hypothetical protein